MHAESMACSSSTELTDVPIHFLDPRHVHFRAQILSVRTAIARVVLFLCLHGVLLHGRDVRHLWSAVQLCPGRRVAATTVAAPVGVGGGGFREQNISQVHAGGMGSGGCAKKGRPRDATVAFEHDGDHPSVVGSDAPPRSSVGFHSLPKA